MMFRSGDRPDVMCSGWSVNAFRNPSLFSSRYSRTMNASGEVALTLYVTVTINASNFMREKEYVLLGVKDKQASDELSWNVVLKHIDNEDLGCDRYQAAAFIQILSYAHVSSLLEFEIGPSVCAPILAWHLIPYYPQSRVPTAHDTQLLAYCSLFIRGCVHKKYQVLRCIVDLEECTDHSSKSKASRKNEQVVRCWIVNFFEDGLMER